MHPPSQIVRPVYGALPETGYVRLAHLHGNPKLGIPGILPWSTATTWRKVKAGLFPAPVRLSERVTAWEAEAIRIWLHEQSKSNPDNAEPKPTHCRSV